MAAVTISDIVLGSQNSYHGPFKRPSIAGATDQFYTIGKDSGGAQVRAYMATDPTDSFAQVDAGSSSPLTSSSPHLSTNIVQVNEKLHVVIQDLVDDVFYCRFDMSSDTWDAIDGGSDEDILVTTTPNGTTDACDIVVLSTGVIRIVYQGATQMDMGSNYETIDHAYSTDDGENWTSAVRVSADGEIHYTGPRIVLPPNNSDQCHIFYESNADASGVYDITQRALDSSHNLRTVRDLGFNASQHRYVITHGIGFVRSGISKVRIGYRHSSTVELEVIEFDAFSDDRDITDDSPTGELDASSVSTATVAHNNTSIVACLASDGATIRGLFANADDGDDLWQFDDGGSDSYSSSEHFNASQIDHISCNVYDRDGPKLAMIYDDGGTVQYDEIDITPTAIAVLGAGVNMGTQNSFHGPFDI